MPAVLPGRAAVVMFRADHGHSVLPVRSRRTVRVLDPARMHRRLLLKKKEIIARSRGRFAPTTTVRPARSARGRRVLRRTDLQETASAHLLRGRLQVGLPEDQPRAGPSPLVLLALVLLRDVLHRHVQPQHGRPVPVWMAQPRPCENAAPKVRVSIHAPNLVRRARRGKFPSGLKSSA